MDHSQIKISSRKRTHVAKREYHEVLSSRGEIEAYEHGTTKEDEILDKAISVDPSTVVHG